MPFGGNPNRLLILSDQYVGNVTPFRYAHPSKPLSQCARPIVDEELANVLAEIAEAMAGEGAVLSLHSDRGAPALLGACVARELEAELPTLLAHPGLSAFVQGGSLEPDWSNAILAGRAIELLTLPVSSIEGHNRLVVSVIFRHPSLQVRTAAEQLFASRRPIAMGYFRLWQLERVRARRLATLEAACDVIHFGMLFFCADGTLDFANAAANDLLDIGDGLRRHRRSVQASDIADSVKLQVGLNHATAANDAVDGSKSARRHAPLLRLHRKSGEPLIAVIVAAEQRAEEPSDVAVMVYLFDPAFDMDRLLRPVCKTFALSPVETQLTCHLAAGHSILDAANTMKIKEQTARGYLKHIFVKTDTRRQGELVHLMLSNIFRVGRTILPEVL